MSTTLKTQDSDESYFKYRSLIVDQTTEELEILIDAYSMIDPVYFKTPIKAIKDELSFRDTSLGKELY